MVYVKIQTIIGFLTGTFLFLGVVFLVVALSYVTSDDYMLEEPKFQLENDIISKEEYMEIYNKIEKKELENYEIGKSFGCFGIFLVFFLGFPLFALYSHLY